MKEAYKPTRCQTTDRVLGTIREPCYDPSRPGSQKVSEFESPPLHTSTCPPCPDSTWQKRDHPQDPSPWRWGGRPDANTYIFWAILSKRSGANPDKKRSNPEPSQILWPDNKSPFGKILSYNVLSLKLHFVLVALHSTLFEDFRRVFSCYRGRIHRSGLLEWKNSLI